MSHIQLLVIDPQVDFVATSGALSVRGAKEDMVRLANFVRQKSATLEKIHVTLDTHSQDQIFHPMFWRDREGNPPAPFTVVSAEDVEAGVWMPREEAFAARALEYVRELKRGGRFSLIVWPYHCLSGSGGAAVDDALFTELCTWERSTARRVDYVRKGGNFFTEHYSALKAEVEDAADDATRMNTDLIASLALAEIVYVAGEALDYCVYNTVRDLVSAFASLLPGSAKPQIVVLEDCASPIDAASVPRIRREFEALGIRFALSGDLIG